MSRTRRQRAYCTFCEKIRHLNTMSMPLPHGGLHGEKTCGGTWRSALACDACDGTGKIKTIYETYLDEPCNVCKGATRIIRPRK